MMFWLMTQKVIGFRGLIVVMYWIWLPLLSLSGRPPSRSTSSVSGFMGLGGVYSDWL